MTRWIDTAKSAVVHGLVIAIVGGLWVFAAQRSSRDGSTQTLQELAKPDPVSQSFVEEKRAEPTWPVMHIRSGDGGTEEPS